MMAVLFFKTAQRSETESKSRHALMVEKAAKATEERMLTFQVNVDRTTGYSC